jgi:PAS domain-containing protein
MCHRARRVSLSIDITQRDQVINRGLGCDDSAGVPSTEVHRLSSPGVVVRSKHLTAVAGPLDARCTNGTQGDPAVLSEAVLNALPSPAVLLDPDGKVLRTNSAWQAAVETVDDDRIDGGAGVDYFRMARRACGIAVGRKIVDALRALSRGERASVAMEYSLEHPAGTRWYHLQASRVDEVGR